MFRFLSLLAVLALAGVSYAQDRPDTKPKNIDVVICLDISNSMDGLINSAKAKLWDVINELAKIKPSPNLRVALYSYGCDRYNAKTGWIQRELELTTDLDALYQKLYALKTQGGTEYATRVCRDAINDLKWDDAKDALKIIFVCGNEPANQDSQVSLQAAADLAKSKGIFINSIYCGNDGDTDSQSWRRLAELAGGKYTAINQNRNVVANIATPQDAELAKLTGKISETYLPFGKIGVDRQKAQETQNLNSEKAGIATAASRAVNLANGLYQAQDWCLVDRAIRDSKFDVTKLPEAELPEALRKLTPEKRVDYLKELVAKREAIQKQIMDLSKQREEHIRQERRKQGDAKEQAFDEALRSTLRTQAESRGIAIPKE